MTQYIKTEIILSKKLLKMFYMCLEFCLMKCIKVDQLNELLRISNFHISCDSCIYFLHCDINQYY